MKSTKKEIKLTYWGEDRKKDRVRENDRQIEIMIDKYREREIYSKFNVEREREI